MRRLKRPPRVAALCVLGETVKHPRNNVWRISLLRQLVQVVLASDWHPIDAIVLPGGFFRMRKAFGATSFADRREALRYKGFALALQAAVRRLQRRSPGIRIVTGVLASSTDPTERTEQACLAFGTAGPLAISRKITPTHKDTRDCRFVSPYVEDFASTRRFIGLANGSLAALHSCYDLFGTADLEGGSASRRSAIRRLLTQQGSLTADDTSFTITRRVSVERWHTMLRKQEPDVALVAIHGFEAPGRDGYWQRHGVARASASLGGALVVGAAHFESRLPTTNASTLAAHGVEHEHIFAGTGRLAHRLAPIAALMVETRSSKGLLRLFTPPPTLQIVGEGL